MCPSAAFHLTESISGTVAFQSGGTYTINTSTSAVQDVTIPASCLTGGATCADLQTSLNQSTDAGPAQMGTCSDSSGGCACHVTDMQASGPQMGTYSVSGTMVTLDGTASPYCVKGNTLLVQTETGVMGMAGSGTITFSATKQ